MKRLLIICLIFGVCLSGFCKDKKEDSNNSGDFFTTMMINSSLTDYDKSILYKISDIVEISRTNPTDEDLDKINKSSIYEKLQKNTKLTTFACRITAYFVLVFKGKIKSKIVYDKNYLKSFIKKHNL